MWFELLIKSLIIKSVIIGITGSIPLGPIGVLCIQRTLSKNQKSGFISGLGSATVDAIFAAIALFSLSVVLSFIESHMMMIKVIGGISILMVGIKIFLTNPVIQIRRNRAGKSNLWHDYISLFIVTLANPAFILIFVALFAAFGIHSHEMTLLNGAIIVSGVFLGAAIWWFTLTFCVNLVRKKFRPRHMLWINRIAGAAIAVLGAVAALSVFINTSIDGILPK